MNRLEELSRDLVEKNKNINELITAIQNAIMSHANSLTERYEPKSIIESRFIPAEEAYEKGIVSCGAMTNISAEILGHLGFEVKLIHGECKESVDHAWVSVFDPESKMWKEFDLTRKNAEVPSTHLKKSEVKSWEEIRKQIEDDHKTMIDRRKERGLI